MAGEALAEKPLGDVSDDELLHGVNLLLTKHWVAARVSRPWNSYIIAK